MSDTRYLLPGSLPYVQGARLAPEITHSGASVSADVASCASVVLDEGSCASTLTCLCGLMYLTDY